MKRALSILLVLSAGVAACHAQTSSHCANLRKEFDFKIGTQDAQNAIENLQARVEKLESCLDEMQLNASIHDPQVMESQIDDNYKKLIALEGRLNETEDRLLEAEKTIRSLDVRLLALEPKTRVPARKRNTSNAAAPIK